MFARLDVCDHKYPVRSFPFCIFVVCFHETRAWVDGYYNVKQTNQVLLDHVNMRNVRARIEILYFQLLEKFETVRPDTFERMLVLDGNNFQIW